MLPVNSFTDYTLICLHERISTKKGESRTFFAFFEKRTIGKILGNNHEDGGHVMVLIDDRENFETSSLKQRRLTAHLFVPQSYVFVSVNYAQ